MRMRGDEVVHPGGGERQVGGRGRGMRRRGRWAKSGKEEEGKENKRVLRFNRNLTGGCRHAQTSTGRHMRKLGRGGEGGEKQNVGGKEQTRAWISQ